MIELCEQRLPHRNLRGRPWSNADVLIAIQIRSLQLKTGNRLSTTTPREEVLGHGQSNHEQS